MPNHVHMVLAVGARYIAPTSTSPAPANLGCLKPPANGEICDDFHHNSELARAIGAFKAAVTRTARARCIAPLPGPVWQRLYHDHIIRGRRDFENIMDYIDENPARWDNDVFNRLN